MSSPQPRKASRAKQKALVPVPPPPPAYLPAISADKQDEDLDTLQRNRIDRFVHAFIGRVNFGISPASLGLAWVDWASHFAVSPGKQSELGLKAARKWARLMRYAGAVMSGEADDDCITPLPQDHRFNAPAWKQQPFHLLSQSFLLGQQWWHNVFTDVRGVTAHHEDVLAFLARQILDVMAPSNFPLTNPEILQRTIETGGTNFRQGFRNLAEDVERLLRELPPAGADKFLPGRDVAITPGKVVFRNRLIELIQYSPTTPTVFPEPVLIVPAWIMKYYILDLSPENSLVRYLVSQGHTVFMISWKNPSIEDRDLGMQDYLDLGFRAAIDAVADITGKPIHCAGYCLGGTLAAIGAAKMARDRDDRLVTLSLFAAQIDFTEAGELMLFIDESQVAYLEDLMWNQGFLDTRQMSGTFQLLRSNDLIWSKMVRDYLMGERQPMSDLMAWNADATRMPFKMHSEYLRKLFLQNDLAAGRYRVDGRRVSLEAISVPAFAVGTEWDHIAPWQSVYKVHTLTNSEVTFVLTSGGHNVGIVSAPGQNNRTFRLRTSPRDDLILDPDAWYNAAEKLTGSWWPRWESWLAERSGPRIKARSGSGRYHPICEAPGTYVHT